MSEGELWHIGVMEKNNNNNNNMLPVIWELTLVRLLPVRDYQ